MTGLANRHESTPAYPKVSLSPPPMGTSNDGHARKNAALRGMCAFVIQVAKPVPLFFGDIQSIRRRISIRLPIFNICYVSPRRTRSAGVGRAYAASRNMNGVPFMALKPSFA